MKLSFLGRSGLRVSALGLGTTNFGSGWRGGEAVDEKTARNLLAAAVDHGVNLIDTADVYGYGAAESMLGRIVGRRRSKLVIATKVLGQMRPGDPDSGGLSRRHIAEALNASLKRLKTDYVDMYMPHAWDAEVPLDETLEALHDAKVKGKVRVLGCCGFSGAQLSQSLEACARNRWHRLEFDQVRFSLISRGAEADLPAVAAREGVSVIARGPLGGGVLAARSAAKGRPEGGGRWQPEDAYPAPEEKLLAAVRRGLERAAEREDLSPAQAAVGWVLARPGVDSVVVAARSVAQLKVLLHSRPLSRESVAELERLSEPEA